MFYRQIVHYWTIMRPDFLMELYNLTPDSFNCSVSLVQNCVNAIPDAIQDAVQESDEPIVSNNFLQDCFQFYVSST